MIRKRHSDDSTLSPSEDCFSCAKGKCATTKPYDIWPVSKFDKKFPNFQLPLETGSFSLDECREYVDSRSHLRVYCPPSDRNVAWHLSHGYDVFVQRDECKKEYIDHLLKWIQVHGQGKLPLSSIDSDLYKCDGDIPV